jgi:hypothetical protein
MIESIGRHFVPSFCFWVKEWWTTNPFFQNCRLASKDTELLQTEVQGNLSGHPTARLGYLLSP